jgi:hypothetical protein
LFLPFRPKPSLAVKNVAGLITARSKTQSNFSSLFIVHWRWSARVLLVFTDFLSWSSRILIKKTPSGAEESIGASESVLSGEINTSFKSPSRSGGHFPGITSSPDFQPVPIVHESNKISLIIT